MEIKIEKDTHNCSLIFMLEETFQTVPAAGREFSIQQNE